jgi:hypothetical protein
VCRIYPTRDNGRLGHWAERNRFDEVQTLARNSTSSSLLRLGFAQSARRRMSGKPDTLLCCRNAVEVTYREAGPGHVASSNYLRNGIADLALAQMIDLLVSSSST